MQEDVIGTQRSVLPTMMLVQCVRCGKSVPRNEAKIVDANVFSESQSDFDYICRDCQTELSAGEGDIPDDML
jgi:hypothetical protein